MTNHPATLKKLLRNGSRTAQSGQLIQFPSKKATVQVQRSVSNIQTPQNTPRTSVHFVMDQRCFDQMREAYSSDIKMYWLINSHFRLMEKEAP